MYYILIYNTTYCIKSSMTNSSSMKPSSYIREAGVRPYFCSIIFNACSWSSKFFCIIILLNISYSFAAHICSNRFYKMCICNKIYYNNGLGKRTVRFFNTKHNRAICIIFTIFPSFSIT